MDIDDKQLMEQGWADMHVILNKEMPTKDKTRRRFFWLLTGVVAVGVVLAFVYQSVRSTASTTLLAEQAMSTKESQGNPTMTADNAIKPATTETADIDDPSGGINNDGSIVKSTTAVSEIVKVEGANTTEELSSPANNYAVDGNAVFASAAILTDDRKLAIETDASIQFTSTATSRNRDDLKVGREAATASASVSAGDESVDIDAGESVAQLAVDKTFDSAMDLLPALPLRLSQSERTFTFPHTTTPVIAEDQQRFITIPYISIGATRTASDNLFAFGGGLSLVDKSNRIYVGGAMIATTYQDDISITGDSQQFEDTTNNLTDFENSDFSNKVRGFNVELGYERQIASRLMLGLRADYLHVLHNQASSQELSNSRFNYESQYDAVQYQVALSPTIAFSPLRSLWLQLSLRQPVLERRLNTIDDSLFNADLPMGGAENVALRTIDLDIPRSIQFAIQYQF